MQVGIEWRRSMWPAGDPRPARPPSPSSELWVTASLSISTQCHRRRCRWHLSSCPAPTGMYLADRNRTSPSHLPRNTGSAQRSTSTAAGPGRADREGRAASPSAMRVRRRPRSPSGHSLSRPEAISMSVQASTAPSWGRDRLRRRCRPLGDFRVSSSARASSVGDRGVESLEAVADLVERRNSAARPWDRAGDTTTCRSTRRSAYSAISAGACGTSAAMASPTADGAGIRRGAGAVLATTCLAVPSPPTCPPTTPPPELGQRPSRRRL
jgi:hypothetical protein